MNAVKTLNEYLGKAAGDHGGPGSGHGGGPGSRGGHVIGHTSSGKAIYASHGSSAATAKTQSGAKLVKEHHPDFSNADHLDAGSAHVKMAEHSEKIGDLAAQSHHQGMAAAHVHAHNQMRLAESKKKITAERKSAFESAKNAREGGGTTSSGKAIAPIRPMGGGKYNHPYIHDIGEAQSASFAKNKFKSFTGQDHRDAADFHLGKMREAQAAGRENDAKHHGYAEKVHDYAADSMGVSRKPEPKKVSNTTSAGGVTSSGKRIAHAESGKYEGADETGGKKEMASFAQKKFKNFTGQDHRDAANFHHATAQTHANADGDVPDAHLHHMHAAFVHHEAANAMGVPDKAKKSLSLKDTLSKAAQTLTLFLGNDKIGEVEMDTQDLSQEAADGHGDDAVASGTRGAYSQNDTYGVASGDDETPLSNFPGYADKTMRTMNGRVDTSAPDGARPAYSQAATYGTGTGEETPLTTFTGYTDADVKISDGVDGQTFGSGAPDVPSTILNPDDVLNLHGNPTNEPQALKKVNKSLPHGNYTQQELTHQAAHARALHERQATASRDVRLAPVPGARAGSPMAKSVRPDVQHGVVHYSFDSDARAAAFAKGEDFYVGGAPSMGARNMLQKGMGCGTCGAVYSAMFSDCPQCGAGVGLKKSVSYASPFVGGVSPSLCNTPAQVEDVHYSSLTWGSED